MGEFAGSVLLHSKLRLNTLSPLSPSPPPSFSHPSFPLPSFSSLSPFRKDYFKRMSSTPKLSPDKLAYFAMSYNSVFLNQVNPLQLWESVWYYYGCVYILTNQTSFPCALLSAGCVVEMTEQVVTGKVRAVTLWCVLSHTKTAYLSGSGSGYETIVSNNDDVILLSVTLFMQLRNGIAVVRWVHWISVELLL